eukprot:9496807-Heterocapsa_arctica.AAC.1
MSRMSSTSDGGWIQMPSAAASWTAASSARRIPREKHGVLLVSPCADPPETVTERHSPARVSRAPLARGAQHAGSGGDAKGVLRVEGDVGEVRPQVHGRLAYCEHELRPARLRA